MWKQSQHFKKQIDDARSLLFWLAGLPGGGSGRLIWRMVLVTGCIATCVASKPCGAGVILGERRVYTYLGSLDSDLVEDFGPTRASSGSRSFFEFGVHEQATATMDPWSGRGYAATSMPPGPPGSSASFGLSLFDTVFFTYPNFQTMLQINRVQYDVRIHGDLEVTANFNGADCDDEDGCDFSQITSRAWLDYSLIDLWGQPIQRHYEVFTGVDSLGDPLDPQSLTVDDTWILQSDLYATDDWLTESFEIGIALGSGTLLHQSGTSGVNFLNTFTLDSLLVRDASGNLVTPESLGIIVWTGSGAASPNQPVPEPGSLLLLGLCALAGLRRRRRRDS